MFYKRSKKRGFTLTEIVIATAISSFIFIFVAYVLVASATNIRAMTNDVESCKDAFVAIDQVRYTLLMGEFGTTTISNNGHTLEFIDPNMGGVTSSLKYEDGSLWYDRDISDNAPFEEKVDRLTDMTFEHIGHGAIIRVDVTTRGRKGEILSDNYHASMDIYLRNF